MTEFTAEGSTSESSTAEGSTAEGLTVGAGPPAHRSYRCTVKWDGRYVAGVNRVSALRRSTQVVEQRDGGGATSHKAPGRTQFEAVTLERGVTRDADFDAWASAVLPVGGGPGAGFRKDVVLELQDEAGRLVVAYTLFRCWVSEYEVVADLDADANAVAIEHLTLENEGWSRNPPV
jgi:phage tail-like protein